SCVRQLDADRVFAGDRRENIDPLSASRSGKVSLQADNLVHTHAFGRVHFVASDGGAFGNVAGRHCNAELCQRIDQDLPDLLEFGVIGGGPTFATVFVEQTEQWQDILFTAGSSDLYD